MTDSSKDHERQRIDAGRRTRLENSMVAAAVTDTVSVAGITLATARPGNRPMESLAITPIANEGVPAPRRCNDLWGAGRSLFANIRLLL